MDKQKSILNVTISVASKIVTLVLAVVVRRLLIDRCGNDVNGLYALYVSIIGFLSIVELGVGGAITFCMYRPIVEGDNDKVSALYHLFRKLYLLIGGAILLGGILIAPFVPFFVNDHAQVGTGITGTFIIMLISVVITYLFVAKSSLINAYKNNYITTTINSGGIIVQYLLQILILIVSSSFSWYLACRIMATAVQWSLTNLFVDRNYRHIIVRKSKLDKSGEKEVAQKIKAMFLHKIGLLLINSTDSLIISAFVGVAVLGKYSNYTLIQTSMNDVIILVFTSLTSVLGHLYAEKSRATAKAYCYGFHLINFMIGIVFYLGYYAVIDNLIEILFGTDLVMSKSVSAVITLNGFVQFLRSSTLTFRDATGTFYNDRWKPLIEGIVNVLLSVLLVKQIGVVGVIAATILTNLLISHIVEPYVLYKHAFSASPKGYYIRNYGMILLFAGALVVLDRTMVELTGIWTELIANGFLSVGISCCACAVAALFSRKPLRQVLTIIRGSQNGEEL